MGKKLLVGNLGYRVSDGDLEEMFSAHGAVQSAQVIVDRDTGRSKGFGFVEMGSDQEAQVAIAALHGKDTNSRALTVNEANPRDRDRRGGRKSLLGLYSSTPIEGLVTPIFLSPRTRLGSLLRLMVRSDRQVRQAVCTEARYQISRVLDCSMVARLLVYAGSI
jgi:cold-inducible RNA-binding protein